MSDRTRNETLDKRLQSTIEDTVPGEKAVILVRFKLYEIYERGRWYEPQLREVIYEGERQVCRPFATRCPI